MKITNDISEDWSGHW